MHIVHVIPGLDIGGAETMLLQLVRTLGAPRYKHTVLNLQKHGRLAPVLEAAGARVVHLGMPRGRPNALGMMRLLRAAYREPVDVVQGWMYHGNLAAQLVHGVLRPVPAVVWSVHSNITSPKSVGVFGSRAVVRMNAVLSPRADALVYIAQASMASHAAMGFSTQQAVHIPGGIDITDFTPNPRSHAQLCSRLAVPPQTRLIGLVARLHPMKDHRNFFAATRAVSDPNIHFVLVGDRLSDMPESLRGSIDVALLPRLHWLGPQANIASILQGLDICTLSSNQEALPRILLEAMACKVPCVATDVGDCAALLRDVGWTAPVKNPAALARAWAAALDCPQADKEARLERGRRRVQDTYSSAPMGEQFGALYERLCGIAPKAASHSG